MTKQITISELCYAELLRKRKETQNNVNGKALSMSNVIMSSWSEIRLFKDEQDKLRAEIIKAKEERDFAVNVALKPKSFNQRVKAVFFP